MTTMPRRTDAYKRCPACDGNRSHRSLVLCYVCWSRVPDELKRRAYREQKKDPKSLALGETAAEVIASVKTRGHDREVMSLRKGNAKRHRGSLAA